MKLAIERTMFGFNDGIDAVNELNDKFTFLSVLLNRLLSEKYDGKKIKFLNLFFYDSSEKLEKAYGKKYFLHYYGGQFTYKKVISYPDFLKLDFNSQKQFIWHKAYEMLQFASRELKNHNLLEASEYAFHKGIELNLNADYRMLEENIVIFKEHYKAALWVNFLESKMEANFTLEKDNKLILKTKIDEAPNGMEFFLVMFQKIQQQENGVVIRGEEDVSYLPLEIAFEKENDKMTAKFVAQKVQS